jgi:hypothetical protein
MRNMTDPWLDDLLDRHPGEPVPDGFAERLRARIRAEEAAPAPVLRPRFGGWAGRAVAAALLLAAGFWLGRGRPEVDVVPAGPGAEPVNAGGAEVDSAFLDQLEVLYEDQELLEDWDLVVGEDYELALRDATVGTWELEEDGQ